MSRKIRFILVATALLAWFGYRTWQQRQPDDAATAAARPAEATKPVAQAKPRMLGRLAFRPCNLSSPSSKQSIEAQCTTHPVPEDRSRPDGRKVALNIAWLPPSSESNVAPDPVFFLAGGPGQGAVESYPLLDPVFAEVRKQRHVILVDQRGTGDSNLLSCEAGDDAAGTSVAAARTAATECVKQLSTHADLRHYATTDAVADLDDVRKAIGATQVNLVGISYGTRVAQQYAMRHPRATRSIVLDSVVPNTVGLGNIVARNLDDALALQFALCKKAPACKDRLGDPRIELDQLLAKLRAAPVTVTYRDASTGEQAQDVMRAETVAGLVRMYAYMPAAGALLPKLIHDANNGRYSGLMALSKMLESDMKDMLALGMHMSVVCTEDAASMTARAEDERTVLGNQLPDSLAAMCEVWPKGKAPADFNRPLSTPVPALVVAGEFDPVTPPRYAKEVVKTLPNGRLFVLRGQGHSVLGAGCMPKLFAQFVEKADAKALDGKCLEQLDYVPPFTNFNGWEP